MKKANPESDAESERTDGHWPMDRRRLLRATGAGLGSLSMVGFGGEIATAETGYANGPFERTYTGGTINMGQIRAEEARGPSPTT